MVYLCKECGEGHKKFDSKKISLFRIIQKINDNAYILDFSNYMKIFKTFDVADLFQYYPTNYNSRSSFLQVEGNDAE
ncbi:hypothetical protein MANES_04G055444v8 [Manihot esculenta]|uniref:Uncharacterized protein n=1 Tax=Manihot esculenta TaxID=3983 RepID=A0ACB7HUZ8_MANES|nr:hypothetical protein MANES_04G055444v8 [Manihot esculenta]